MMVKYVTPFEKCRKSSFVFHMFSHKKFEPAPRKEWEKSFYETYTKTRYQKSDAETSKEFSKQKATSVIKELKAVTLVSTQS